MKKPFSGSFNEVVDKFAGIVSKNPALAQKNNWPTNRQAQEDWIDEREAARMVAHGWFGFVDIEGSPPPSPGGVRRSAFAGGVAAANTALTGLAIYKELFSGDSKPVAKSEAEWRAEICVSCPKNKKGGLKEWFVANIAKGLTELYGVMKDLDLTTSRDNELGTCEACLCPLKAKTWVELPTILKHMEPDVRAKLWDKCWITNPPAGS